MTVRSKLSGEAGQLHPAAPVYVLVEKDLTFVGAGMGRTIVDPDDVNDHPPEQYWAMGFRIWGNGIHCAIRDLTIENGSVVWLVTVPV